MIKTQNFEKVEVTSFDELFGWLERNHTQKDSIWIVTYKKHIEEKYVSTSEILDAVLCFGWIDGIRRKLDDNKTMQLISPRKAQHWTKSYKERAAKLIAAGKMQEAGMQLIDDSKASGLWNFMDDVDSLIMPDDLVTALQEYPEATENFNAFNPSSKRNMLRHIKLAKTDKTRQKRIKQLSELASLGKKLPGS